MNDGSLMTMASFSFAFSTNAADQTVHIPFQTMRSEGYGVGIYQRPRRSPTSRTAIPALERFPAVIRQQNPVEDRFDAFPATAFERSMSGAIMTSWLAAMLGIGIFAYGVGWGGGAVALAGVLCLAPALTGVALAGMISRKLRRPLAAVAQAATRLSEGDRSVRIDDNASLPELADVIQGFNRMAASLDGQEKERRLLVAGITHELRTPLTILQGRLHGIEDGVIEPGADETERLLRQVRHILYIVDDLDTLAKIDSGNLLLNRRPVDPEAIFRPAVEDLAALTARHEIRFAQEYLPIAIMGDPVRLVQIFTNLITNAAKHSPVGGEITVRVAARDGHAIISVTDEGPGFEPADHERLFVPYWRSAMSRSNADCPGSGMGLSLTARLVQAHGGAIRGENRRDRTGACFTVSLPL
jgi:signal transduction histidine kinase